MGDYFGSNHIVKIKNTTTLDVTGKWNAKRSSIPYRDCRCGLKWVGLSEAECTGWLFDRGKKAWLLDLSWSSLRFRRECLGRSGAFLWGGNWASKLLAAIGIYLYGAEIKSDTSSWGTNEVCKATCVATHGRAPRSQFSIGQYSPLHSKGFTGLPPPSFSPRLACFIPRFVTLSPIVCIWDHLGREIGQPSGLVELEAVERDGYHTGLNAPQYGIMPSG
ncbi:hypothetical protein TNCV_2036981 [Trichonephila clavipes]|nr:hypothetical protein TNCV_2036981 [Trichonephila clavipes]